MNIEDLTKEEAATVRSSFNDIAALNKLYNQLYNFRQHKLNTVLSSLSADEKTKDRLLVETATISKVLNYIQNGKYETKF